jgi:hypothetical protein
MHQQQARGLGCLQDTTGYVDDVVDRRKRFALSCCSASTARLHMLLAGSPAVCLQDNACLFAVNISHDRKAPASCSAHTPAIQLN